MSRPSLRGAWIAAASIIILWGGSGAPVAQYFGQNVVRYHRFAFHVLETPSFDVYHYDVEGGPETPAEVRQAARIAERWYARLSHVLGHAMDRRQPLILYANHPHFRQTNAVAGGIGDGTAGVTEAYKRRIVLPLGGSLAATNHVIGHELAHAFQFDATQAIGSDGVPAALHLPLWFVEGMAEYLAIGPDDPQTALWVRDAVLHETLPAIDELGDPARNPYRWGHAFWAYIAGRYGDDAIPRLLLAAATIGDPIVALEEELGTPIGSLSAAWHESLHSTYAPVIERTMTPSAAARPALVERTTGGRFNLSPAISPDGRYVALFSERDRFSIDLFLADPADGRIVRRLAHTAADPHFDSLQFINSAGAWHPEGGRFMVAAIVKGEPVLTVVDVETGRLDEEIQLPGLGEILSPAWSPDGRYIAFSANVTGVANLFVYDLERAELQRLTDDLYAAYTPAWSPDGRTLAFSTDRFTTDLDQLTAGALQIAAIDPATREIRRLAGFDEAANLSPQWSIDGRALYFVSTRGGIPNIYRTDLGSGETRQLTNLATGVSGLTAESPSLSVATAADRLVFSAVEDGAYAIYAIEGPDLAGEALSTLPAAPAAVSALPPDHRGRGRLSGLIDDPEIGLPAAETEYPAVPYSPRLSLDFISDASFAAGTGRFGSYIGGGISFFFSDMLGNHQLATGVEMQGSLRDIGGFVGYENLSRRITWGVVVQRVPFRSAVVVHETGALGGEPVLVEQLLVERQVYNNVSGIASYPFNRTTRVEFRAGATRLSFDREVQTEVVSLLAGGRPDVAGSVEIERRHPLTGSLTYGQGAVALVYDTAVHGPVSPVMGRRMRLEVGQSAGDLRYSTVLADYRHYVRIARPIAIAARILHSGRYGPSAEDPRFFPMFLGYQDLVRGYDVWLDDAGLASRLSGSRILVGNVEVRFPLALSSDGAYRLPVEGFVFADAGSAWGRGTRPTVFGGTISPIASAGAGVRASLAGFATVEIDIARPFDRPGDVWVWQFGFTPAF